MPGYDVDITATADKTLSKLHRKQPGDAERIEAALAALAALSDEPRPVNCKRLTGIGGVWRIRVGNYGVCYEIHDRVLLVLVVTISTREDVYERLRRHYGR